MKLSNKEQVIVCLRWVDSKFEPHKDFIGLHFFNDITAATIVRVLKDTILHVSVELNAMMVPLIWLLLKLKILSHVHCIYTAMGIV